jgi:two-component system chemotaxis sensor kinase CheA
MVPEEIVERFRTLSIERFARVEMAWNRVLLAGGGSVAEMLREVHTVKGDAAIVGETSVHQLCQKLEDLLELAEQLRLKISDDFELVVTMAIQFVGMLLRAKQRAMAGLDLAGFIRQIDDVLHESRRLAEQPRAATHRLARPSAAPLATERLADDTRGRLAVVATTIYLEGLTTRDVDSKSRLHRGWSALQQELARLEATDVDPILERHASGGRELARQLSKEVGIEVERSDARVTPRVAEAIDVALLHVVRNAIDHGIEDAACRARSEKPARSMIRISAVMRETEIEIAVEDDGPGIDVDAVRAAAVAKGIDNAATGEIDLVFEPGVSTRTQVTDLSGRGVGLDAVRTEIARAGGRVRIETSRAGTTIRCTVPAVVRRVHVYELAVPGATLPLAVSARWTLAMESRRTDALDPLRALGIGAAIDSRDMQALRLRWGFLEVTMPAACEPALVVAERICPTPDSHPVEVVTIEGREALLVRPEHLDL